MKNFFKNMIAGYFAIMLAIGSLCIGFYIHHQSIIETRKNLLCKQILAEQEAQRTFKNIYTASPLTRKELQ